MEHVISSLRVSLRRCRIVWCAYEVVCLSMWSLVAGTSVGACSLLCSSQHPSCSSASLRGSPAFFCCSCGYVTCCVVAPPAAGCAGGIEPDRSVFPSWAYPRVPRSDYLGFHCVTVWSSRLRLALWATEPLLGMQSPASSGGSGQTTLASPVFESLGYSVIIPC